MGLIYLLFLPWHVIIIKLYSTFLPLLIYVENRLKIKKLKNKLKKK